MFPLPVSLAGEGTAAAVRGAAVKVARAEAGTAGRAGAREAAWAAGWAGAGRAVGRVGEGRAEGDWAAAGLAVAMGCVKPVVVVQERG